MYEYTALCDQEMALLKGAFAAFDVTCTEVDGALRVSGLHDNVVVRKRADMPTDDPTDFASALVVENDNDTVAYADFSEYSLWQCEKALFVSFAFDMLLGERTELMISDYPSADAVADRLAAILLCGDTVSEWEREDITKLVLSGVVALERIDAACRRRRDKLMQEHAEELKTLGAARTKFISSIINAPNSERK